MPGIPIDGQVGQDLSDDAAELEAMTGEPGSQMNAWFAGQRVDDEVLVGGVGEHARFQ